MHLLYLDDSGSAPNKNEKYFVLGGLSIPENTVRWLANELDCLAEKIHPDDPSSIEFHASVIFSGKQSPWDNFSRERRKQILIDVLSVLENAYSNTVLFATAVHKPSCSGNPVHKAFEDITGRFDMYLQRISTDDNKQRGLVILDKSSYETKLQSMTKTFRSAGNRWGNELRSFCEVPLFVDSKSSRIVQLADHIAYAVFRRYDQNDISYFNCIEDRFDTDEKQIIHGLNHIIRGKASCTCPSCLSRRHLAAGH